MATAAQIQAELAAGPQTQAALDAALLKYSPAEMAAAFPQFGGAADFANARQEAQTRSAPSSEFVVGGGGPMSEAERQRYVAVETANREAAAAKLAAYTPADPTLAPYFANPQSIPRLSGETVEQAVERLKQVDMDRTTRVANRDAMRAQMGADEFRIADSLGTGGNAVRQAATGGGLLDTVPTTTAPVTSAPVATTPAAPTAPANPRIQAIQQWYNSNAGRTDPQAQGDLNRWLATSGFTAREINAALPQWGLNDLQNAMRTAIGEVAQQTPFAPVAAQPMQPLVQPYTSIASQLPGGADTRMQEIRNWYAANEGRGTQADLDRWLASGYTAQEINRALPQWGVADLDRAIATARQAFPQAEVQSGLAQYQNMAPGAQYAGSVSPYGLIMDQMQPFQNPYADSLANTALGGYNPGVYNLLLDETVDPVTGMAIPNEGGAGGASGADGGGDGTGNAAAAAAASGSSAGADGGPGGTGIGEGGGTGMSGYAKGGLVDRVAGPNPPGPDDGAGMLDLGEYVIKKSSVKKYGAGLLDMINEGKIPAKKMKSLLG
jgi:hypothetical protein